MRSLSGQLLPVLNYAGPLACGDCGGPALQPAPGIARPEQRGNWGWRICQACDQETAAWSVRHRNPLAALVADLYDPVAALAIGQHGPDPYRILTAYSMLDDVQPTDDPGRRWEHVSRTFLEHLVDQALAARWEQAA